MKVKNNPSVKKIIIVGFGSIGKKHYEIIHSFFPLISVGVLRHSKFNQEEIKTYGIDYCFENIEQAVAFNPDAAIIANPSSMHLKLAKIFANLGIHLLIEKPISNSCDGVQSLINLCSRKNIILMTAYNLRFSPSLKKFYDLLHKKKIGAIYSAHIEVGQYLPDWRPKLDYRDSVSARKDLGGGVLLELSHEIDYLQWIFGSVQWVNATLAKQSALEIDVEDSVFIQVGINGNLNLNQLIISINMDFIRQNPTRYCQVIGEKGTLRWDGISGKIELYSRNNAKWQEIYSKSNKKDITYEEEIKHFISTIETNNSPCVDGDDGYNALKVIDAARESNLLGKVVHIK